MIRRAPDPRLAGRKPLPRTETAAAERSRNQAAARHSAATAAAAGGRVLSLRSNSSRRSIAIR